MLVAMVVMCWIGKVEKTLWLDHVTLPTRSPHTHIVEQLKALPNNLLEAKQEPPTE